MPEHVHLLLSEPERSNLATALQVLKRRSSRRLRKPGDRRVWQKRYYDFNVFSARKRTEKLRYMHRNPVKRGLVERPEDWKWSSYQHYLTGTEGVAEIESHWLARQRERMGIVPKLKYTKLKEPAD
jgi:REP-associated tyrosine transposase